MLRLISVTFWLFFARPAAADCLADHGASLTSSRGSPKGEAQVQLEAGQQITAIRKGDQFDCSMSFALREPSDIVLETAVVPPPKDYRNFASIPFDIRNIDTNQGFSRHIKRKFDGLDDDFEDDQDSWSDEGELTKVYLESGRYVLTFPSRGQKIYGAWKKNVELKPNNVRMIVAGVRSKVSPTVFLKPHIGETFDVGYQAWGESKAIPVKMDSAASVIFTVTSHVHFSNPAVGNSLQLIVASEDTTFPAAHRVFPRYVTHSTAQETVEYAFYLPAGRSVIHPFATKPFQNEFTSRELWAMPFVGKFEQIIPAKQSALIVRLEKVLISSGYRKYIEPVDVASVRDVQTDGQHHEIRLADFEDFRGYVSSRSDPEVLDYVQHDDGFHGLGSEGTGNNPMPKYVLLLELHEDGFRFMLEQSYIIESRGQSVLDLLLTQLSLALSVSRKDIGIVIPARCTYGLVRGDTVIDTNLDNAGCGAGASSVREIDLDQLPKFGALKSIILKKNFDNFENSVQQFLSKEFGSKNIQYLTRESDTVEANIRGLRGRVVKGSEGWELLYVLFIRQREEATDRYRIRLESDCRLAFGAGVYPPDTQFDTSIEPEHSKSLMDFVNSTLDDFVHVATGGN